MTAPAHQPPPDTAAPADALGGVWELLDELPPATASRSLAATTVELAAAARHRRGWWEYVERVVSGRRGPLAIVAAALVAGLVAGRLSQPRLDGRLLDDLPLVQHLDLLREAGSERFLEAVAARDPGVPPRLIVRAGPELTARAVSAWRAEIDALAAALAVETEPPPVRHQARRDQLTSLSLDEKVELERAMSEFGRLSANEHRAIVAVARALVDPSRPHLREAAVVWHTWLATVRPEDRAEIIDAGTDKRLEWIDWYARRPEGFPRPGRPPFDPRGPRRPPGGPVTP